VQKGQLPIFILVGILVIVAVAGGAYYLGRSTSPKPSPTPVVTSTPTPSPDTSPTPNGAREEDYGYGNLINDLRTAGINITDLQNLSDESLDEFLGKGRDVVIDNKGSVRVYEYPNIDVANVKAQSITPDGGTIQRIEGGVTTVVTIDWAGGPPNYYKKGKLLVLYWGNDLKITDILRSIFGSPFAGPGT
jgi:hypothetical protein